eukprot:SAG11_NODE_10199_length_847_cov_2.512032_1_plen_86_part_10
MRCIGRARRAEGRISIIRQALLPNTATYTPVHQPCGHLRLLNDKIKSTLEKDVEVGQQQATPSVRSSQNEPTANEVTEREEMRRLA